MSNNVSLLFGARDGRFRGSRSFATGIGPSLITSADFNNDSKPDVATTNSYDGTVSVYLGNGSGILRSPLTFAVGPTPHSIVSGDLNNNGIRLPTLIMTAILISSSGLETRPVQSTCSLAKVMARFKGPSFLRSSPTQFPSQSAILTATTTLIWPWPIS
ncbi:MAG: hypothetical protein DME69_00945 [Verrucomicrobia bacterium]|nr:MAG: hypothetical protein DME69_00945 [Verrucomicrobiota bacterium]